MKPKIKINRKTKQELIKEKGEFLKIIIRYLRFWNIYSPYGLTSSHQVMLKPGTTEIASDSV